MFMVSLVTVVKWKKKPTKDLLVNAWINEIWHNLLAITKNVELIHTITWMHFENTTLNKSNQSQMSTCCLTPEAEVNRSCPVLREKGETRNEVNKAGFFLSADNVLIAYGDDE